MSVSRAELFILKLLIKPLCIISSRVPDAISAAQKTAKAIQKITENLSDQSILERVLVNRPLFVEDSSRHWSVAMLCRHLTKVNHSISRAIEKGMEASLEMLPDSAKRLRAVKPEIEQNNLSAVEEFSQSIILLGNAVKSQTEDDLLRRKIPHPWLGDLTHIQWVWWVSVHHRIHLRQLKKIVAKLD